MDEEREREEAQNFTNFREFFGERKQTQFPWRHSRSHKVSEGEGYENFVVVCAGGGSIKYGKSYEIKSINAAH